MPVKDGCDWKPCQQRPENRIDSDLHRNDHSSISNNIPTSHLLLSTPWTHSDLPVIDIACDGQIYSTRRRDLEIVTTLLSQRACILCEDQMLEDVALPELQKGQSTNVTLRT